jgi:type IV secretion system protein TrbJ
MNRYLKRYTVVLVILLLAIETPALALFGLGDIVFDPTSYGELVSQLAQMEQQYEQLIRSYQMLRNQYDWWVRMGQTIPQQMMNTLRTPSTPWSAFSADDAYGSLGPWVQAVNQGYGAAAGYKNATQALTAMAGALSKVPAGQADRIKNAVATVELTDGANVSDMDLLGKLRTNATAMQGAIAGLEAASLSADPNLNTEIAVLNKINVAGVLNVKSAQDTNKLLAALAEQRIIEAKRTRDAEVQAINNHLRFVADEQDVLRAQGQGSSQAMLAWRMP